MAGVEKLGKSRCSSLAKQMPVGSVGCASVLSSHCHLAHELEWPSDIILGHHHPL